ncbi:hypothetical protein ACIQ6Y_25580 [Streptomyces sp. NPDC096205]|uniref:hypothetical protein n=1 Tax=Streptomyces sp. NPDC096205 TaxID=3366081 RepID=UPI0037F96CA0
MSRLWRRAVLCWAVLVAVGGGLTLWLQDSAQPPPRARWEESRTPVPVPSDYTCPTQDADLVVCAYATIG